jgi:FkbM family methyltransferase
MISKDSIKAILKSTPSPLLATLRVLTIGPARTYIRFAPWSMGRLLLYDSVASHLWWLETNVSAPTVFGCTLEVDASDIVGKHIYYFGIWEPNLTRWIQHRLRPGDLFVDVGANIGYYSLLASKLVGEAGRVVSIEALPQTFGRLERNLRRNGARNVRTVNLAAWDKPEKLRIFTRREGPSGSTTVMPEWADQWHLQQQVEIEARPLAAILTPEEIRTARLIKIDVEGAEWHVISEMASWLAETGPTLEIVVEVSRSMMQAQGKSLEDILRLFADHGFRSYHIRNDYLASTCIRGNGHHAPQRITDWPNGQVDQFDLVFSHVDAEFL